jgi:hypothetical protein
VKGAYSAGGNCLALKYDPNGSPLWTRTAQVGPAASEFSGLAVDPSGNAYLAGSISGTGDFDLGAGATAS